MVLLNQMHDLPHCMTCMTDEFLDTISGLQNLDNGTACRRDEFCMTLSTIKNADGGSFVYRK